jgi:nucleotide-binding universal stress UspA family protein
MLAKILVAVDLLNENPPEVAFAAGLAKAFGSELVLVHVVDYVPQMFPVELPGGYPMPAMEIVEEAASKKLARLAREVGATARPVVEVGSAAERIVDVARREGVDHIVIGSHRKGALQRVVLGSVADRVAHTAECPVTIVR